MTALAAKADVVIPGTGFASTDGTYTNTERRLQLVQAAIEEDVELANWEIAAEIAHVFEVDYEWENTEDISGLQVCSRRRSSGRCAETGR